MPKYIVSVAPAGNGFIHKTSADGGKSFRLSDTEFASEDLARESGRKRIINSQAIGFLKDPLFLGIISAAMLSAYLINNVSLENWQFWIANALLSVAPIFTFVRGIHFRSKVKDRVDFDIAFS